MKRYISILSLLVIAFGINPIIASECIDEDCELDDAVVVATVIEEDAPDILEPIDPAQNFWIDDDFSYDIESDDEICEIDESIYNYNCPFDTTAECEVWYTKPIYNESVAPRAPHLSSVKTDGILATLTFSGTIDANDDLAKPLLERYQILMRASHACCSEGIIYKMRQKGAKDAEVYQFLKDDANEFAVASRCMVMNDDEIAHSYSNGVTGQMIADVRNACLCKNRQWFESLLEPFFDIYERAPLFADRPFVYSYTDSMQRDITVYVNDEIQTTSGLLGACPK